MSDPAWHVRLYIGLLAIGTAGILFALHEGTLFHQRTAQARAASSLHESKRLAEQPETAPPPKPTIGGILARNSSSSLSRLFLQCASIIAAAWVLGWLFKHIGQPPVIGEMVAGILLGPSFLGIVAPQVFQFLFAPSSLDSLRLFSQLGVCLFMFAVGMELNLSQVRHSAPRLLIIGQGGILIPYLFGVLLAMPLFERYAKPDATFIPFALFMGISMSITAFPMLVRILKDHGLFHTPLGNLSTLCAAVGDVTAWCILAVVVAIAASADIQTAVINISLVAIYGLVMLWIVRPLLARMAANSLRDDVEPGKDVLALMLGVVLVSAFATEILGIHALFGAFVAGIIMPAGGGFRRKLTVRLEHFASVLLLPIFFAFIGLRTQVNLLTNRSDLLICGLIILLATVGKLGGTAVLCRLLRFSTADSFKMGILMNTRGLMELIALNIGYEMGILSQRIFTMLVLMAIVTTFMTGPLVGLIGRMAPEQEPLPR